MPPDATLEIASIRGIPLYDGDIEAQGIPAAVSALKEAIVAADGVLLVTPEYNNSIPGVFKNAIDWLSRPASDVKRVFGGRRFAIIGASPGAFGTILSQAAWLPVMRTLGTQLWFGGRVAGGARRRVFDEAGNLKDAPDRGAAESSSSPATSVSCAAALGHTRSIRTAARRVRLCLRGGASQTPAALSRCAQMARSVG